ncbi:hypothetical protein HPP92_028385 [Vanilla planifolia]|uniref:Uncharacterized protein n=1 Tax=Vanilla planifolia TaxID=51239 RepID=A0A835U5V5_VANPL|nr:hypothetical protein HPP92_028385 [Vanilla planifolia]
MEDANLEIIYFLSISSPLSEMVCYKQDPSLAFETIKVNYHKLFRIKKGKFGQVFL